jgi:hypothetical protein
MSALLRSSHANQVLETVCLPLLGGAFDRGRSSRQSPTQPTPRRILHPTSSCCCTTNTPRRSADCPATVRQETHEKARDPSSVPGRRSRCSRLQADHQHSSLIDPPRHVPSVPRERCQKPERNGRHAVPAGVVLGTASDSGYGRNGRRLTHTPYSLLLRCLRPGVAQGDDAVPDLAVGGGIGVEGEVAEALELVALARVRFA